MISIPFEHLETDQPYNRIYLDPFNKALNIKKLVVIKKSVDSTTKVLLDGSEFNVYNEFLYNKGNYLGYTSVIRYRLI